LWAIAVTMGLVAQMGDVRPMVWTTEYKYSPDAVLLVLASDIYCEDDYIRNGDEYLALQEKMKGEICDPVP
jgi:hypothetical protein